MTRAIRLAGTSLELVERGQGRPLLFLHAGEGLAPERPWLDLLARTLSGHRAVASRLRQLAADRRRCGRRRRPRLSLSRSRRRAWASRTRCWSAPDLGGWIAAEMMVRRPPRFSLPGAGRPARHQVRRPRRARHRRHARHDRAPNTCGSPGPIRRKARSITPRLPDTELAAIVRGREAFALFGWKPYMHNPRLKRWLHRIDRPDAAAVGRAGRHRHARLWRGLAAGNSRRQDRRRSRAPAISRIGNSRRLRRTALGVRRQPQRIAQERADARLVFLRDGLSPGLGRGPEARLAARGAAERAISTRRPGTAAQPLSRRVRAVRRGRARHHGQRAPQHRDLPDRSRCRWRWRSLRAKPNARGCCRSARRSPTGPTRCASPRRWRGSTCCRAAGWRWAWSRARPTRSRRPTATRPI